MIKQHFSIITLLLISSTISAAQTQAPLAKKPPVATASGGTAIRQSIRYGSTEWNQSSKAVDNAFIFLRDKNSGKIAKIVLEETEPDSSVFSGDFSISWGEKGLEPEIYIPPKGMRGDAKDVEKFNTYLQSNKNVKPQPVALKTEGNRRLIDVFDTEEQARRASEAFAQEQESMRKAEQAKLIKPKVTESNLDAAKLAERTAKLAEMAADAARREAERIRLAQLEEQRIQQKLAEQAKLSAQEKQKKKSTAEKLVQQAMAAYQRADFKTAEENFRQAIDLDPENKSYFFMYGVSLYRTDKFDEALVTLKVAKTADAQEIEKKYYLGLIHFRLKELDLAEKNFGDVRVTNTPVLSASAAFYEGMAYFAHEKLDPAQSAFEYVLDNSSDPALDKKAEEQIEKILKLKEYKRMAARKWLVNAKLGPGYDSNILLQPDNINEGSGQASEEGGFRAHLMADAEYRFTYKPEFDMSGKVATSYAHSFDQDLFNTADPWVVTATLPTNFKSAWRGMGSRVGLTPGYETILMDYDDSQQKQLVLTSFLLNADCMLVMRDDWFSTIALETRVDDSQIADTVANNADAQKFTLKKSEILFLDSTKKRILMGTVGLVLNNADGDNKKFNRLDFGVIYSAPIFKYRNTSWMAGLNYYSLQYDKAVAKRKDTNTSILFGVTKQIDSRWSWSTNINYSDNTSDQPANDYSKVTAMALIGYSWEQ